MLSSECKYFYNGISFAIERDKRTTFKFELEVHTYSGTWVLVYLEKIFSQKERYKSNKSSYCTGHLSRLDLVNAGELKDLRNLQSKL